MDFLWHKVSGKEKEDIKKQAKEIMDSFSKKLAKIDKNISEPLIERPEGEREELAPQGCTPKIEDFTRGKGGESCEIDRKIMFENAPDKNDDFIIAERKKW